MAVAVALLAWRIGGIRYPKRGLPVPGASWYDTIHLGQDYEMISSLLGTCIGSHTNFDGTHIHDHFFDHMYLSWPPKEGIVGVTVYVRDGIIVGKAPVLRSH